MNTRKSFQLSRGCSIAFVLAVVLTFLMGACLFRTLLLPNGLGSGLGHGGLIMNILLSAEVDHREMLAVYDDGNVYLQFPDKQGLYGRYEIINKSGDEWQALEAVYQQWCTNPPKSEERVGIRVYEIGISCSAPFGHYMRVPETALPPIIDGLFKRIVTKQG
jgi:hypothetical protein